MGMMGGVVSKKIIKRILIVAVGVFVVANIFSAIQAYSCTHFNEEITELIPDSVFVSSDISSIAKMLVLGVEISKPRSERLPDRVFENIWIDQGNDEFLSGWLIRTDTLSKGLIIYFHGYRAEKSMLLDYAYQTIDMGYDALLVDFMGSGDSYGLQTTVGYKEAENVKTVFDYASNDLAEKNIYLFGFSMGAAAILKAQHDYNMPLKGIIAEASYGTMYGTIKNRLTKAGLLSGPLAAMFSFWGGVVNDIDAFSMNPQNFVSEITVPVMIACGGQDQYIPQAETQLIYDNLASKNKVLVFYPDSKHEPYLSKYSDKWKDTIETFLTNN